MYIKSYWGLTSLWALHWPWRIYKTHQHCWHLIQAEEPQTCQLQYVYVFLWTWCSFLAEAWSAVQIMFALNYTSRCEAALHIKHLFFFSLNECSLFLLYECNVKWLRAHSLCTNQAQYQLWPTFLSASCPLILLSASHHLDPLLLRWNQCLHTLWGIKLNPLLHWEEKPWGLYINIYVLFRKKKNNRVINLRAFVCVLTLEDSNGVCEL